MKYNIVLKIFLFKNVFLRSLSIECLFNHKVLLSSTAVSSHFFSRKLYILSKQQTISISYETCCIVHTTASDNYEVFFVFLGKRYLRLLVIIKTSLFLSVQVFLLRNFIFFLLESVVMRCVIIRH